MWEWSSVGSPQCPPLCRPRKKARGKVICFHSFFGYPFFLPYLLLMPCLLLPLKIIARLQQYMSHELPDVQAGFKAEEPEIKSPTPTGSPKKQESSRKTSISALLTMPKPLTVWITINCLKFWERWEYQTTWLASWETCMQVNQETTVRTGHGAMDWFQIGKVVDQGCISSPCLFNFYAEYIM